MPTAPAPLGESVVARNALVILAVIAGGATLYALAPILTPLALAMFLAVMVDGFARVLKQRLPALPKRAALPLALILSILLFGGTAFFVTINAAEFVSQLLGYAPKLDGIIANLAGMVRIKNPPTVIELIKGVDTAKILGVAAGAVQDFARTALFVLVYLGLILASRRGWDRQDAVITFLRIRDGVERYLFVQTITGLMVAGLSWIAMFAVGLNDSLLWALLIVAVVVFVGPRALKLIAGIRGPAQLAFSTASSEAAYPGTLEALQTWGVSRRIASFVLPLGYSFNLDGTMMYCTFATLFVAQAYGIELTLGQQITMLLLLMITSKGVAGVPRASLVVISATLTYFHLPEAGLLLILAVDNLLDMGRSATNVVGNSVAAAVVAKWEGQIEPPATDAPAIAAA